MLGVFLTFGSEAGRLFTALSYAKLSYLPPGSSFGSSHLTPGKKELEHISQDVKMFLWCTRFCHTAWDLETLTARSFYDGWIGKVKAFSSHKHTSHLTVTICVLLQRRTAPATEHAASVWISRAAGGAPTPVIRAKVSASRARTAGPSRPRFRPRPPSPASQPAPSRP